MQPETAKQEEWGSTAGFIIATIGAAVGLGNIWRFAYVAGDNGGGAFLVVYLVFVLLIGLPLVVAELSLGRSTRRDPVQAFATAAPGGIWAHAGWVGFAAAVMVLSFYAVVAGWALKYFFGAVTGALWEASGAGYGAYFDQFIGATGEPILWQGLMLLLSGIVVAIGVNQGIERLSSWLMPLLALIVIGLAVFSLSLPGSSQGVAFLFVPDWSALGERRLYIAALGQAFFSLGLGMAIFLVFGSYLSARTNIPAAAGAVALGDSIFAMVAGLAIFPAVFALGGDPAAGPRLAFITFPQILLEMPGGRIVGPLFFFLLSAAALTSMISILEASSAVIRNRLGLSRAKASGLVTLGIFGLGVPCAMSYGLLSEVRIAGLPLLDAVDKAASNVGLPFCGLVVALFVGWRLDRMRTALAADLGGSVLGLIWIVLLRIPAPAAIILIFANAAGLI